MTPRSLSHRAPLLGLVAAWAAGAIASHAQLVPWSDWVWAALAVTGLALAWTGGNRRGLWIAGLAFALIAAGALRTGQQRQRLVDWDALALPPREAHLTLRIERVFAREDDATRAGGLARVLGAAPHLRDLEGQRVQFAANWPTDALPSR